MYEMLRDGKFALVAPEAVRPAIVRFQGKAEEIQGLPPKLGGVSVTPIT
ncbi:hypothetical protein ACIOD2_00070 [Amycolatopsis sp. NPDC088138]